MKGAINAQGERVKPLTPGTRLSLIERLTAWAESNEGQEQIFWLHDEAGTGKSALAAHMANHWQTEGVLAARFFFDRNGGRNLRRLDRFCVTLAKEISDHYALAQAAYLDILDKSLSPEELPFSEAFQLLVISVAERLSTRLPKPVIFVIDALDECHEDDIQSLISSVLSALKNTYGVRFLLTSRPTKEITSILDGMSGVAGKGVVLLDVKHGETQRDHDTSIYVRQTLKDFSAMDQNLVIQCASGVFLWATLACETLLRTITPRKVLEKFQNNTPNQTMQTLYEAVLEASLPPNSSPRDLKLLHAVLQGVALTYMPVSIFSIRTFFSNHKDETVEGEEFVEFFVKKLGSIMKDGTPFLPIYILHPTFREFIEDQKNGAKFYISPPDGHYSITVSLLALLMQGLTPNVLCLDDGRSPLPVRIEYGFEPPARLSLDIEAPLRYAVAFWATHASIAIGEDGDLHKLVSNFFESRFLVWIEWSSAIRDLSESIESLRRLRWAVKIQGASQKVSSKILSYNIRIDSGHCGHRMVLWRSGAMILYGSYFAITTSLSGVDYKYGCPHCYLPPKTRLFIRHSPRCLSGRFQIFSPNSSILLIIAVCCGMRSNRFLTPHFPPMVSGCSHSA
jgi:AAA ATPase domain